ncbi:eukaryotictranslation initiation factor 5a-like protein [Leptotrombidium deliense]|uniref:Eukaryotictranslation initiation factor 5a-like protein n=1 Tax=Leptotrombidium deliense TaxID=299467 RepID=A0A443RYB8_9ACAR|nr:eukaryotictranslation initiation factor 5a-like protein [Leptotrombidium deliense]
MESTPESNVDNNLFTNTVKAKDLKNHDYVILNEHPCIILKITKNGNKVHVSGKDIFTSDHYEDSFDFDADVISPIVVKNTYLAIEVCEDRMVTIFSDSGEQLPLECSSTQLLQNIKQIIESGDEEVKVVAITACGKSLIVSMVTSKH